MQKFGQKVCIIHNKIQVILMKIQWIIYIIKMLLHRTDALMIQK